MISPFKFIYPIFRLTFIFACLSFVASCANRATIHKDEASGLYTWSSEKNGFSIELIQLLPDFVRAVYESHHFPPAEIEEIAGYCVFGTIVKNTSQQRLNYRVADWHYVTGNGVEQALKTKTQWIEQWRKAGITFSWTLLPDESTFEVGDWQQGFTTVKLSRNDEFNLIYTWNIDGTNYAGKLRKLRCAPERLPAE